MSAATVSRLDRAAELFAEGKSPSAVANVLGIRNKLAERWRKELLVCDRCAEPLRDPSPDDLCGWCQEETAGVAA